MSWALRGELESTGAVQRPLFGFDEEPSLAPIARNSPVESLIAAKKVNAQHQLEQVLLCLLNADEALTDDETAERCGLLRHSAGTRRGVARSMGLVVKAGRGVSALGNPASTWTLTDKGREYAWQLRREVA